MKYELTKIQKDKLLADIHQSIRQQDVPVKKIGRRRIFSIVTAAAVLLAIMMTVPSLFRNDNPPSPDALKSMLVHSGNPLVLPDGTNIISFDSSHIRFDEAFATRNVEFNGRAVFEVKSDTANPFIVQLENGYDVIVTGTTFEVHTQKENSSLSLIEGTVVLKNRATNQNIAVHPGETIYISKEKVRVLRGKQGYLLGWYKGFYELKNTYLGDICQHFNESSEVQILLADNLRGLKISGRYPYENNPKELLKAISIIYKLDISEKDGKIVIVKN